MTGAPPPAATTLVIVPALDEEASIGAVLDELHAAVPTLDVVVVDDGSTDRTAAVARAHGAAVLSLPFNLGVGGALRTGFRYAERHGYERVVQVDADGQHDPAEIMALLAELDAGADLVIGSRFAGTGTYRVGALRGAAMGLLRATVRGVSGQRFTDTSSGFRAFSGPMLAAFADDYPAEYLSDTVEALLVACAAGFVVVEVPVSMRERAGGQPSTRHLRLLFHYLRVLLVVAVTRPRRRERRPRGRVTA